MKIEEMRVEDIIPYENNPRKNDGAVEAVANSIREFGFKVPIIVNGEGIIIAGHTRLKAAERLGLETVPVIRANDLTEEQVRAFRLADNKVGEIAGWDFGALADELADITEIDMAEFGFTEGTSFIDDLMEEALGSAEYKGEDKQFAITIYIDKQYETAVENYISENGKAALSDAVVAEAVKWTNSQQ